MVPVSQMQSNRCVHYVRVENARVISGMSVLYAAIKGMATMVCASVEILVSTTKGDGYILVDMLRTALAKRKATCFMLTQAANTRKASTFWVKNALVNKHAKYLAFMMYTLDHHYTLCCDTTYMMLKL